MVHYRDPVPHLPFESILIANYNHIPVEVWYSSSKYFHKIAFIWILLYSEETGTNYKVCPPPSGVKENPNCANSLNYYTIADHTTYLGTCTECTCWRMNTFIITKTIYINIIKLKIIKIFKLFHERLKDK